MYIRLTAQSDVKPQHYARAVIARGRSLNNTAIVVLGMVAAGRRNGYEIARSIERSTQFFWPASAGGIYPELKRLRAVGLLRRSSDPRGDAARHSYELTDDGRAALSAWLVDETPGRLDMRHEDLLRLFLAADLPLEEQARLLERVADGHERRARLLRESRPQAEEEGVSSRLLVLEYGIALNEASAKWCRDAVAATRDRGQL